MSAVRPSAWNGTRRALKTLLPAAVLLLAEAGPGAAACLRGINLAGAEFGEPGGAYGESYIYPSEKTVNYFAGNGFDTVRLPFLWERLQPQLGKDLDAAELERLKDSVGRMRAAGQTVILDPHNYGRYGDRIIGTPALPDATFADFWQRLAKAFAGQDDVLFGLMNEPHDMDSGLWLKSVNASLAAIRATGANNLVLVPGVAWTGAHSWQADVDGASNASTMIHVEDPTDNYAFEVHQYLDSNFSGTHKECTRVDDAVMSIHDMTDWLRANGKRGFLGEFGGSATTDCMIGLARMTQAVDEANDVWIGWTYWAAGDWWPAEEPLNIQPTVDGDRLQMKALTRRASADKSACPALAPPAGK